MGVLFWREIWDIKILFENIFNLIIDVRIYTVPT